MPSFKLSNKAREDLIEIARYTNLRWGREQRQFYLKQLDDTFHALADNPKLGRCCDEIRRGYFKFPKDEHVIFYRHGTESNIEIIRVLHRRMDADARISESRNLAP